MVVCRSALQAGRAGGAKGADFVDTVEIFPGPQPHRALIVPEQLIQHRDIVAHQRFLIAVKRRRHLGETRAINLLLRHHAAISTGRASVMPISSSARAAQTAFIKRRGNQLQANRLTVRRTQRHGDHRQAKEGDGLVSIPMLARIGSGWPLISMVCAPMGVALHGVAGAISTSAWANRALNACCAWRRKRWA
jgi:hypothetical protein